MGSSNRSIPQAAKASIALFFANVVTKGIAYLTTPLYTRILTAEEYGQVSVFLTWVQVFGILAMFNLSAGVFNNGMLDYKDRRDEYAFSLLMLSNVITIGLFGVLAIFYPLVKEWIGLSFPLLVLMFSIFFFQPAYHFWSSKQRYELKYKALTAWTIALAVLSPGIAIICMLVFKNQRFYARIFGAEVPLIIVYICFYARLAAKNACRATTKYWAGAIRFNLPLLPHYLSTYLLGSSDRLMISKLVSDSATAYYSVAYSVAAVVMIIWSSANASLIPYTYEKCEKKEYGSIARITQSLLVVFAVICVCAILLAPEVIALMATQDYYEAVLIIPPVVGGVFFQVQYFIYANIVYYYKKPKYVMLASVTAAALNILLNALFIPVYGYVAAGYTTIFCYFVQAAFDYCAMKKVVHESVYNMRFIGALSLIVIVISLFSGLLYRYTLQRYCILLTLAALAFAMRRRILGILSQIKR